MPTPEPDLSLSSLQMIQTKVRRLTRSPSNQQLSNADLNDYINTFVLYDFPEHLRLFNLRTTLTFYAEPNIDTYDTNTTVPTDPLYNFTNKYLTVAEPVFIAGYRAYYAQSREQFYGIYPIVNSIASIGFMGDGIQQTFSGTLANTPILQENVLFDSVDINNNGLKLIDVPNSVTMGDLIIPNDSSTFYGSINYITGAFTVNFPTPPAAGAPINSQTVPYVAALPQALLFFDGSFVLRPVPDQPYRVQFEVYNRPSELLASQDTPELSEWWQYIAYGAAKKVFEDRMDQESVQLILPEFRKQEMLVQRRTIVQNTTQRSATIYTEQTGNANNFGNWGSFNGSF